MYRGLLTFCFTIYKRKIIRFVLFGLLLQHSGNLYCQDYHQNTETTQLTIDGKKIQGYSTTFDFPAEDVRYGFWKYSRSFGHPKNQRGYYQVTIPESTNESNMDIILYAQTLADGQSSTFKLGIDLASIPEDKKVTYDHQAKNLIRDFKLNFYYDYFQEKIDRYQKRIKKLGKKYKRLAKKQKNKEERMAIVDEILKYENEVKKLHHKQLLLYKK